MKSIIIIGAGISGISTLRWAKFYNFIPVVLEKNEKIGGCWFNKSYENIKLQTTRISYGYSDHKYKNNVSLYPSGKDVLNYLQSYLDKHNLNKYIKFNCKVEKLYWNKKMWEITYTNLKKNIKIKLLSKYLIIASGFYSDPKIPKINGMNQTDIEVFHSVDFSNNGKYKMSYLKNKNVMIVGNGPTGIDIATNSVNHFATNTTILYRTPRWIFMRHKYGISFHFFISRFTLLMVKILPKKLFISILYILYLIPFFLGYPLLDIELPKTIITRKNLTLNEQFFDFLKDKKLHYEKNEIKKFHKTFLETKNKKCFKPDLVIFCTGYEEKINFLKQTPLLYKRILPLNMPNCTFVGQSPSFNWIQLSDLQARWSFNYFLGKIKITKKQMIKKINYDKNNLIKDLDYWDLSYDAFYYSDDLANDFNVKNKNSIFSFNYWFSISENDTWKN